MTHHIVRLPAIGLLAVVVAGWTAPASAQNYTGRIDIIGEDSTGARLPGVAVQLSDLFNDTAVTDSLGQTRFLNLVPGTSIVKCSLSGFACPGGAPPPGGAGGAFRVT